MSKLMLAAFGLVVAAMAALPLISEAGLTTNHNETLVRDTEQGSRSRSRASSCARQPASDGVRARRPPACGEACLTAWPASSPAPYCSCSTV